ncbi:MAG: hypothetical protein ABIZ05_04780 [Pseudonocardiaceae bacterium]
MATLSQQLSDLGCRPKRERIPTEDGTPRQVRGYLIPDIRAVAKATRDGNPPEAQATTNDE